MMNKKMEIITAKDAKDLEELRKSVLESKKHITKTYIYLARMLSYIRAKTILNKPIYAHWGYTSFEEYCEQELNMSVRKAEMLINISDFIDSKILVDKAYKNREDMVLDEIDSIGWSKALILTKVVNSPNDFLSWVSKAKSMSRRELADLVSPPKLGKIDEEVSGKFEKLNFQVLKSSVPVIQAALEHIRKISGDNLISGPTADGLLLYRLCQHYLTNFQDHNLGLEELLTSIAVTYDVELTCKTKDGEVFTIKRQEPAKDTE